MENTDFIDFLLGYKGADETAFAITNDGLADWAIRKIIATDAKRDRLLALADAQIKELHEKKSTLTAEADKRNDYLRAKLQEYFETVEPSSVTKTLTSYKLLSGKLVLRKQPPEFVRDEAALVGWAEAAAPDVVRIEKKVNWSELKKRAAVDGETVFVADTGEVIQGVVAKARPDVFEVKT